MSTPNNLAKIRRTGLNAFGQPYTGNAIGGVQNRRMMGGPAQGPLSQRGPQSTGVQARMEREEAEDQAAWEAARRKGNARAQAAAGTPTPPAPAPAKKTGGALIPGSSPGSAVWKSDEESTPKPVPGRLASAAMRSANAANRLAQARRKSTARFEGLSFTEMQQRKKRVGLVFGR